MRTLRRANDRGQADYGWLRTAHSFSFGDYFDPQHVQFRSLRVMNEDHIEGGAGFPMHGHRDMEIVTYVTRGAIEHRDSEGGQGVIRPGEVQRMSAGTGIRHSEFNHLADETTSLYQIWFLPERAGRKPGYEQASVRETLERDGLVLAAAPEGGGGAVAIGQDAKLWIVRFRAGQERKLEWKAGRGAWIQVVGGAVEALGERPQALRAGDGLTVESETSVTLRATEDTEVLFFDLA